MTRKLVVWALVVWNLVFVPSTFGAGSICPMAFVGFFGGRYYYSCRTGLAGNDCAGDIVYGSDTQAHTTSCSGLMCNDRIGGGDDIYTGDIHMNATGFAGCDLADPGFGKDTTLHADFTCRIKEGETVKIVRVLIVTRNGVTSGTSPDSPIAYLVPAAISQEVRLGTVATPVNSVEDAYDAAKSSYDTKNVWNFQVPISVVYDNWNPNSASIYRRWFQHPDGAKTIPVSAVVIEVP